MSEKMARMAVLAMLAGCVGAPAGFGQLANSFAPAIVLEDKPAPPAEAAPVARGDFVPFSPPCPGGFPLDLTPPQEDGILYPSSQMPGWFGAISAGLVKPHINSHVDSGTLHTPALPGRVSLRTAPLAWTGMPQLDAGYRFAHGAGEIVASYRFLASEGSAVVAGFDPIGAGELKSRLNVNRFNVSYVNHEFLLERMPNLFRDIFAGVGASAANVFFDSQTRGAQVVYEHATSNFAGVGPYGAFGLDKACGQSPFAVYGRLDAAGLVGKTRQHFEETAVLPSGALTSGAASTGAQSNGVAVLSFEGGCSYATPSLPCRLSLGYRWERWWYVGAANDSNADLTIQGFFLRGEFSY